MTQRSSKMALAGAAAGRNLIALLKSCRGSVFIPGALEQLELLNNTLTLALTGGVALLNAASAFVAAPTTQPALRGAATTKAQVQTSGASSSLSALAAGGAVAAAAMAAGARPGRQARGTPLPTTVVPTKESAVTRRALDQSSRYADLSLDEATLVKNGKHVLVAYIMKPKAGYDYLATAAHFAAESSTGTNVN
ncbi:rbcL, partial [Symbiodinium pilosum]